MEGRPGGRAVFARVSRRWVKAIRRRDGAILAVVEPNRIELDRSDGIVVVVLSGEHDVYTAPTLRESIESVIDESVPLVIDLTPTTFLDSSVLRVLLEARRTAEERGLGFAVALDDSEAPGVRRILEVTGLIPVLPVLEKEVALDTARAGHKPG
jgi:anti-sigma B factor antagonist